MRSLGFRPMPPIPSVGAAQRVALDGSWRNALGNRCERGCAFQEAQKPAGNENQCSKIWSPPASLRDADRDHWLAPCKRPPRSPNASGLADTGAQMTARYGSWRPGDCHAAATEVPWTKCDALRQSLEYLQHRQPRYLNEIWRVSILLQQQAGLHTVGRRANMHRNNFGFVHH